VCADQVINPVARFIHPHVGQRLTSCLYYLVRAGNVNQRFVCYP